MNLINLLDYSNSVYDLSEKINNLERNNTKCKTKPSTIIKTLLCSKVTGLSSVNQSIIASQKDFKGVYERKEFLPKTHAFRDCLNDINYHDVKNIHENMIEILGKNKYFENHKYRGHSVLLVDGVEFFETQKNIDGLHKRNHKDGSVGYYYKSLGLMYLSDSENIMLDLVPFEKNEVKEDKEHNEKIKSEGEITVFKRIIPKIKNIEIDIAVLDCMFLNAPCFNVAKQENIDVIAKMTNKKRVLYKDAEGLFAKKKPQTEYEIVEVIKNKKVKYSKESKKKNTEESEKYFITRPVTKIKLNKKIETENKIIEHPKKTIHIKITERVVKRLKVWTDVFQLDKYEYNNSDVRVIKVLETVIEKKKETEKEMYIVTTILDNDVEFIIDLMHRRWDIELKGFRTFKTRYKLSHLYVGTLNAINIIMYLTMIVFNLIELYFNVRTKKNKNKINFVTLMRDYLTEIQNEHKLYKYFTR